MGAFNGGAEGLWGQNSNNIRVVNLLNYSTLKVHNEVQNKVFSASRLPFKLTGIQKTPADSEKYKH